MSFEEYMKAFGKSYSKGELAKRKMAFEASKALVKEHNGKGATWTLGLNEFSDYFPEELKAMRGLRTDNRSTQKGAEEVKLEGF